MADLYVKQGYPAGRNFMTDNPIFYIHYVSDECGRIHMEDLGQVSSGNDIQVKSKAV